MKYSVELRVQYEHESCTLTVEKTAELQISICLAFGFYNGGNRFLF